MSILNISSLSESANSAIGKAKGLVTAGEKAAKTALQMNLPPQVYEVQNLFKNLQFAGKLFGLGGGSLRNTQSPIFGNMTLEQVEQVHDLLSQIKLARKNLWFIKVTDHNPPATVGGLAEDAPLGLLNMLATDLNYAPFTLKGDSVDFGSAASNNLTGKELIEVTMTVFDDEAGTVKRWFARKCRQAANRDGTFGLPLEYCVTMYITHAVPSPDSVFAGVPYMSKILMRPQAMQTDMTRREQGMQEVQLSFAEFESF
jgi:hypothetical protein